MGSLPQNRILLGRGVYRVSISVACDQPIFRGPNRPVEVRLWGGSEPESETVRPDAQRLELIRSFQIDSDPPEPVLVQYAAHRGSQRLLGEPLRVGSSGRSKFLA